MGIFFADMTMQEILPRRMQARELFGDYWLNGTPVFLSDLRGRIVLLDFWDYSDTASQRSLPYLLDWYAKYSSMGLVVVGIHTPKFQFAPGLAVRMPSGGSASRIRS